MNAYDLYFEVGDGVSLNEHAEHPEWPEPTTAARGWMGTDGPAIDPRTWPRGPLTGLPMFHGITLRLPEEYQRRGPEFPGDRLLPGRGAVRRGPRGR